MSPLKGPDEEGVSNETHAYIIPDVPGSATNNILLNLSIPSLNNPILKLLSLMYYLVLPNMPRPDLFVLMHSTHHYRCVVCQREMVFANLVRHLRTDCHRYRWVHMHNVIRLEANLSDTDTIPVFKVLWLMQHVMNARLADLIVEADRFDQGLVLAGALANLHLEDQNAPLPASPMDISSPASAPSTPAGAPTPVTDGPSTPSDYAEEEYIVEL